MADIVFPSMTKTMRLPNDTTYCYIQGKPTASKPYFLFLHSFPPSSFSWRHEISHFSKLGFGIIFPDLLGYGGTDRPRNVEAYWLKRMSEDVVRILDAEETGKVHEVGHDWWA